MELNFEVVPESTGEPNAAEFVAGGTPGGPVGFRRNRARRPVCPRLNLRNQAFFPSLALKLPNSERGEDRKGDECGQTRRNNRSPAEPARGLGRHRRSRPSSAPWRYWSAIIKPLAGRTRRTLRRIVKGSQRAMCTQIGGSKVNSTHIATATTRIPTT